MDIKDALFQVARDTSTVDLNELNKLHERAKADVSTWHDEMQGVKGMYVKAHKGWILQLVLLIGVPFLSAYLLKLKNNLLFNDSTEDQDIDSPFDSSKFL